MHEVGLMEEAVALALEQAARHGARHVHGLTLRVGALAGVVPEALAFAFEVVTRGTPAEGARLEVEHVPAVCYCRACAAEFRPPGDVFRCPSCGTLSAEVRRGHELELARLEVS